MAVRKGNFVCLLHWHSQHKHFFKRLFNQQVRSLKECQHVVDWYEWVLLTPLVNRHNRISKKHVGCLDCPASHPIQFISDDVCLA